MRDLFPIDVNCVCKVCADYPESYIYVKAAEDRSYSTAKMALCKKPTLFVFFFSVFWLVPVFGIVYSLCNPDASGRADFPAHLANSHKHYERRLSVQITSRTGLYHVFPFIPLVSFPAK